jgi:cell division protein FtsL
VSAVAAPRTRERERERARERPRPVRRAPARVGFTSALLIIACAAVLIGIVTLQVAVLRLNSERGDLQAHRDQVVSANSELRAQLGGQMAPGVLAQKAAKQGLVLAPVDVVQTGSLGH